MRTLRKQDYEERLNEIWSRVLGTHAVNDDRGFFEQGGDSLAAAELVAAVSDEFGVEPDIPAFFVNDRKETLLAQIEKRLSQSP